MWLKRSGDSILVYLRTICGLLDVTFFLCDKIDLNTVGTSIFLRANQLGASWLNIFQKDHKCDLRAVEIFIFVCLRTNCGLVDVTFFQKVKNAT